MPDYQIGTVKPAATRLYTLTAPRSVVRPAIDRRVGWYLRLHLLCLILYAFSGKGFAYVGVSFFYVSEALLLLGLIALVASRKLSTLFRSWIGLAMVTFFLWQILCTIPYFADYGINAARDAVVWGYAAFAWVFAAIIVSSPQALDRLLERYRRFASWFLIFGPMAAMVGLIFITRLPVWPGSGIPLIFVKLDEFEAHLAGIAASIVLGLNPATGWLWLVGLDFMIGTPNRGGLVGFIAAYVVACVLAQRLRALLLPGILLVGLFIAAALDIHVSVPGAERDFSAAQLLDDVNSTVSTQSDAGGGLENTKEWRLNWWETIWDYTVRGPYFLDWQGLRHQSCERRWISDPGRRKSEKPSQFAHDLPRALGGAWSYPVDYRAVHVGGHDARLISEGETGGKDTMGRTVRLGYLLLGGVCSRRQLRCFSGKSYGCHPILDDLRHGMGKSYRIQPISGGRSDITGPEMRD